MTRDQRTQLAVRLGPGALEKVDAYATENGVTRSEGVRRLLEHSTSTTGGLACPRCAGLKDWQLAARASEERAFTQAQLLRAYSRADGEMPFLCVEELLELLGGP